ncbi:S-layer homology domain-containing protein [Bacillus infantis]|uniref:S-layer homology domain-containing protein n=1 Tax=Bacillus infantis TaxID=324767 RepID=UPI003CF35CF0
MAYQSKNHRKFLATSLTAAMVASAVAPVASAASFPDVKDDNFYATYVNQLADAGVIEGMPNGTFGLREKVTRAQAAKMVSLIRGLDTENAPAASFTDVKQDAWYADYINALYAAKLVDGVSTTEFAPNGTLTRAQFAKMVVDAYGLELKPEVKTPFTDVKEGVWYTDYIKTLFDHKLVNGKTATTFEPNSTIDRADFAKLLVDTDLAYGDTLGQAKVTGVNVLNSTTVVVNGTGLKNLKADQLTLAGNSVTDVTPAADGKSATVKFASAFIPDQEYTLNTKINNVESSFKFTYKVEVSKAAVTAGTFDDDTKGQRVGLKVNDADADYDALKVAGYTVNFVAVDSSNNAANIFKDASTGLLNDSVAIGDYTVQVTVSKGSTIVVSEKQTIKVRNLEQAVTAVKEFDLTNTAVAGVQKSSTLVVGESATVSKLVATANNTDFEVTDPNKIEVKSSNPAVISVAGDTLSANTPGTATVTVSYGDIKKDVVYTVSNTARKFTKVTPASSSVTIIGNGTSSVTVSAFDQYGDLRANQDITVETPGVVTSSNVTTAANGKVSVPLTGDSPGNGVVLFKDASGNTLGSVGVKVTAVNNVASKKLEVVPNPADPTRSDDSSLDLDADHTVVYALNQYTSENVYNGNVDLTGYTVKYNADVVTIGAAATGTTTKAIGAEDLTITGKSVGSTSVAIYDANNVLVAQVTVTVNNTGYSISSVDFKTAPVINYRGKNITVRDVLTTVASDNDDVVKGINLNKSTAHVTRIVETAGANEGTLYIDVDGDGSYNTGDVALGTVVGTVVSGVEGAWTTAGDFNVFTGVTTAAAGDKGTVVFKVQRGNTIVGSTSVTVDVK